jgi:RNA polymerase sigma-70 factor (ECF subfamily)
MWLQEFPENPESGESLGEEIFGQVLSDALNAIRPEFRDRTWQAFWGVTVQGRQPADVGAELQMRAGTVRVAKSRVLQRLRRELGDLLNCCSQDRGTR